MNKKDGKHGNYGFHLKGIHDETGKFIPIDNPDKPVFVMVHDNSDDGLTHEEMKRIAEHAVWNTVYWSDDRCCYWMYDFKVWDHWCEMVTPTDDEPFWECMHINVYS